MRNVSHEIATHFVRALERGDIMKQHHGAAHRAVGRPHWHRTHLKFAPADNQFALAWLSLPQSFAHDFFDCRVAHRLQQWRPQRILSEIKQIPKSRVDQNQTALAIHHQQSVVDSGQNCLLAGCPLGDLPIELALALENFLQRQSNPPRFRSASDQKSSRLLTAADLLDQWLEFPPRIDPSSPNDKCGCNRGDNDCQNENQKHHFSRKRYPKPRTVSTISPALPSFSPKRRTWV